jgi:hypothetical protein
MILTGKCKQDFYKWFLKQDYSIRYNALHWFENDLNYSMQYGVYVDFFFENKIYPVYDAVEIILGKTSFKNEIFKAIKKANEIYNERE